MLLWCVTSVLGYLSHRREVERGRALDRVAAMWADSTAIYRDSALAGDRRRRTDSLALERERARHDETRTALDRERARADSLGAEFEAAVDSTGGALDSVLVALLADVPPVNRPAVAHAIDLNRARTEAVASERREHNAVVRALERSLESEMSLRLATERALASATESIGDRDDEIRSLTGEVLSLGVSRDHWRNLATRRGITLFPDLSGAARAALKMVGCTAAGAAAYTISENKAAGIVSGGVCIATEIVF